ncbi:MAG TPA: AtpZ/AtpI family protein [Verrucomicrobiae bacterium]|nr:AtpZ/AtpI family protein [Verrucomicrobiae bacterium]
MADPESGESKSGTTREEIMRRAAPLLGIGATFVASIGVGTALGWYLDDVFALRPWLTLTGALMGLVVGFYLFFKAVASAEGGDHGEWSE